MRNCKDFNRQKNFKIYVCGQVYQLGILVHFLFVAYSFFPSNCFIKSVQILQNLTKFKDQCIFANFGCL